MQSNAKLKVMMTENVYRYVEIRETLVGQAPSQCLLPQLQLWHSLTDLSVDFNLKKVWNVDGSAMRDGDIQY